MLINLRCYVSDSDAWSAGRVARVLEWRLPGLQRPYNALERSLAREVAGTMKTSQCAKFMAALHVANPKGTCIVRNSPAREARVIGVVGLPAPKSSKRVTRGSKKFKAVMERHRQIMKEKNNEIL